MPRYRLLALDVDGTLVNSRDELTEPVRAALLRAGQAGVRIVLATGRRYRRALPLVEPLALNVPLITASGALVKRVQDHSTDYCAQFAPGVLDRWLQITATAGYEAVLYADTYNKGYDFFCSTAHPRQAELAEFLDFNRDDCRVLNDLMRKPPPGVFSGFAMGTRDEMLQLAAELEEHLPGALYVHVLRSPRYSGFMCEIAPGGVSKWTAVRRLADQWGLSPDEICAVGDDVNDLPMIEGAGLGVAMGNALEVVKAAADRVAPTHDNDGLVQVVEWVLES